MRHKLKYILHFLARNAARLVAAAAVAGLGPAVAGPAQTPLTPEQRQAAVLKATERVLPAVVTIITAKSGGSGVIFDGDKGYALTSQHVVRGATNLTVMLLNGQKFDGTVVRSDQELDLAIIKIRAYEPLPEASLGDSHAVRNRDPVLAIGAPVGLNHSVTMGEVAKWRTKLTFKNHSIDWMVMHSAPINPGNSGGPLVNLNGEIIGLNALMVLRGPENSQPLYYAVSTQEIKNFASGFLPSRHTGRSGPQVAGKFLPSQAETKTPKISNSQQPLSAARPLSFPPPPPPPPLDLKEPPAAVLKPYLGLALEPLNLDEAAKAGVDPYLNFYRIAWLDSEGPAAQAGLLTGDILLRLNDQAVNNQPDYERIISRAVVGGTIWAEVMRRGQSEMIALTIGGIEGGQEPPRKP